MDCHSATAGIQVGLTLDEIRSLFSAINTAGLLSQGRIKRVSPLDYDLQEAVRKLEHESGLFQSDEDEWLLD